MIIDTIKNKYGDSALTWSALRSGGEKIIADILRKIKPKVIVEIGTFKGLTTMLLSKYAKEVYSFDIEDHRVIEKQENVCYIVCDNESKKNKLELIDFDFAFIDGDHREAGVQFDFDCVKKCGKVLFHDYFKDNERPDINGAKPIIDKLIAEGENVIVTDIFALWRASK